MFEKFTFNSTTDCSGCDEEGCPEILKTYVHIVIFGGAFVYILLAQCCSWMGTMLDKKFKLDASLAGIKIKQRSEVLSLSGRYGQDGPRRRSTRSSSVSSGEKI